MRKLRKCVTALLALCLLAALACVPAMADDYTYTVTLSTGGIEGATLTGDVAVQTGSIGTVTVSGDTMTVEGVAPGTQMNFTGSVSMASTSRYTANGVVESGHDYSESQAAWTINEDTDFVVAYYVAGETIEYTVTYVDADGNTLSPAETFYGTLGAKPVVAYKYIEGYEPQAYNITGTLIDEDGDGESDRVFEFTYTEVVTEVVENVQYETVTVTPAPSAAPGEETAEGEEAAEAEQAEEGEEVAETEETTEGEEAAAEEEEQTGPVELEDLDDEEVPLAEAPTSEESGSGSNTGAVVGGIAAVVVIAGVVCGVVIKKRKVKI